MQVHATCVAVGDRGFLIRGPSGSGKSRLALELIALGARLVADDIVMLSRRAGSLVATAPDRLDGLIEARGIGLLCLPPAGPTAVAAALDLVTAQPVRLPARRHEVLLGATIDAMAISAGWSAGALWVALRNWPPLDPDAHEVLP